MFEFSHVFQEVPVNIATATVKVSTLSNCPVSFLYRVKISSLFPP